MVKDTRHCEGRNVAEVYSRGKEIYERKYEKRLHCFFSKPR